MTLDFGGARPWSPKLNIQMSGETGEITVAPGASEGQEAASLPGLVHQAGEINYAADMVDSIGQLFVS